MTATASMDTRRIHGFCGLSNARCGTVATVENGRFTRLDPDPTHPTGAALCAKGRAAPEIVYARDRLTKPLERTRPKDDPDPGWREISWGDALARIAMQMQRISSEHGPEAFAVSVSSPSTTAIGDSAPQSLPLHGEVLVGRRHPGIAEQLPRPLSHLHRLPFSLPCFRPHWLRPQSVRTGCGRGDMSYLQRCQP
jgi:Molybdopterin oxidoreductase/Molybdopterin oxidoreductase Fe4S4 domain